MSYWTPIRPSFKPLIICQWTSYSQGQLNWILTSKQSGNDLTTLPSRQNSLRVESSRTFISPSLCNRNWNIKDCRVLDMLMNSRKNKCFESDSLLYVYKKWPHHCNLLLPAPLLQYSKENFNICIEWIWFPQVFP